jgi:hypothetical protein
MEKEKKAKVNQMHTVISQLCGRLAELIPCEREAWVSSVWVVVPGWKSKLHANSSGQVCNVHGEPSPEPCALRTWRTFH